jgi:hypothetical protein
MSHAMQAGKQEDDKIQTGPVFVTALVLVSTMVLTYLAVSHYAFRQERAVPAEVQARVPHLSMASNGEPLETKVSPIPQYGMLHQTLFESVSDAHDLKVEVEQHLQSYGWLDASKSTAHIPVERAMELLVQQRQQGGGK